MLDIMRLQKITFLSEAELLNNYDILPLKQTLRELEDEFARGVILKAVYCESEGEPDEIVGSVRGYTAGDTLYVGKLMVHPKFQRQGLGRQLLTAIEAVFPGVKRCELFTSDLSVGNLRLYKDHGYVEFSRKDSGQGFNLVFMEKIRNRP